LLVGADDDEKRGRCKWEREIIRLSSVRVCLLFFFHHPWYPFAPDNKPPVFQIP
jgi:hypothetical protein